MSDEKDRNGTMSEQSGGDESSRLGGRLRRYAQVSTSVGGLAARMAGEKVLGVKSDPGIRAAELKKVLGNLKGPLMKVAQILSTIPDALPRDYAQELAHLQTNAPRMGWAFVKRRMASQLGTDWRERFDEFETEAAAAASLGQVHRALALDGRRLACKLQYPDMDSIVEADLKQLRVLVSLYHGYDRAVDATDVLAEIGERLREELDYQRESRHMRLYRHMLADEPGVHIPEPVSDLTTRRLLTMTWMDGEPILSHVGCSQDERNTIAYNMFRAWYVPFYYYGVIHGDAHLGNYAVRADQGINLLDFGCVRVFPTKFVGGVIDLYHALDRDDRDLAVHAYETWGFGRMSNELIDVLNRWAEFVYAPLLENRTRRIQETEDGVYGRDVAAGVHAALRRVGGVKPPREFVLMDRAAIGLGSVFLHLKAEINWYRLFHELISDFDPQALADRQARALAVAGLEENRSR
jgi:predicted unusual protein kinase regulating ubiquinone biosynthesis (AarF/ABC1/UbiB family)